MVLFVLSVILFLLFLHLPLVTPFSLPKHGCVEPFIRVTIKETKQQRQTNKMQVLPSESYCDESNSRSSSNNRNTNKKNVLVLGVCGGIASGKSKACEILLSKILHDDSSTSNKKCIGYIDADKLAHSLYDATNPDSQNLLKEILIEFGQEVVQQQDSTNLYILDRKALGNIVFSDPSRMSELERIVWPRLKNKLVEQIKDLEQTAEISNYGGAVAVVEAAMMLEAGWDDLLDAVWVVRSLTKQKERLVEYRHLLPDEASLKIQAQSNRRGIGNVEDEIKNGLVTAVIDNDGSLDSLTQNLVKAWNDPSCWKKKTCT